MDKLLEAAAVYPREWAEVATRRVDWVQRAPQVQAWLQAAVTAVQQAVPFFEGKLVVQTNRGTLDKDGKSFCNDQLLSVFVAMAPLSTAEFACPGEGEPIHVLEAGFVLAFTPALNGEVVVQLQTHHLAGVEPHAIQLRVFHNPGKIAEAEVQLLLEQAFTHAAPTSVLFSRDPEPAPGTRTTVGFKQNGEGSHHQAWPDSVQPG